MLKILGFCTFLYACASGTWWLFLLAFLLWQFGGSGIGVTALWAAHQNDDSDQN